MITVRDLKLFLSCIPDDTKVYQWHECYGYDSIDQIFDYQEHELVDFPDSEPVLYV